MNGLLEIQATNKWLIDPAFGNRAIRLVNAMMNGHLSVENKEKIYAERFYATEEGTMERRGDIHTEEDYDDEPDVQTPFINVLRLEGPITREGGACTYGSRQLRNLMMKAADQKNCLGHLLVINGPGGVSNCIPDMLQATDYARSKGQPILARIDGVCFSAHIWISAMCDEVYYNNPEDRIGSVGVYWAGITNKSGDVDPMSGGKWHIIYDPESYDKNRVVRDIADDDDKLIIDELKEDGEKFRAYMKSRRPNATDEHLHGKLFSVKDVEGIFVTGQATMQETMARIVELAGNKAAMASQQTGQQAQQAGQQAQQTGQATTEGNVLTPNNSKVMKEQFPALFAALQVEEMQMQEEGAFMNKGLLEILNATIEKQNGELAEAKALAEQLTADKQALEQQVADLNAQMETANGEHAAAIEEKDNQIATLEQEKADMVSAAEEKDGKMAQLQADADGAKASLETATATIAERDQTIEEHLATIAERDKTISETNATIEEMKQKISELNAEVEELAANPAPMTNGDSGVPVNNGTGDAPKQAKSRFRPGMTYKECRAAAKSALEDKE